MVCMWYKNSARVKPRRAVRAGHLSQDDKHFLMYNTIYVVDPNSEVSNTLPWAAHLRNIKIFNTVMNAYLPISNVFSRSLHEATSSPELLNTLIGTAAGGNNQYHWLRDNERLACSTIQRLAIACSTTQLERLSGQHLIAEEAWKRPQ